LKRSRRQEKAERYNNRHVIRGMVKAHGGGAA
jgi:hypothetical protein